MRQLLMAASAMAVLAVGPACASGPMDEASVRQAEDRWSEAFVSGDAAALDALLAPEYVSVSATGAPRAKAEVIALAVRYAAANPGQHAKPLPPTSTVQIHGPAAVVRHNGDADVSVDVFYLDGGVWRAWYSQHTAHAAKPG